MDAKSQVTLVSLGLCSLGAPRLPGPMTERDYYYQRPRVYLDDDALGANGENLGRRLAKLLRHGLNRVFSKG